MPSHPDHKHPTTANQLVVLVLHSPGLRLDNGKPRPVVCDYWRMWTNAKANCQGWHLFLDRIVDHYKEMLPSLDAVGIWTDGSSTQFKGAKNFMLNVDFYRKQGIELMHCYPATGHGGGVVVSQFIAVRMIALTETHRIMLGKYLVL